MFFDFNQIYVFTDFDGTITKLDIGDELFIEFGTIEPYHSQLKSGEMLIHEYWHTVCNSLRDNANQQAIKNFAYAAETDAYFRQFAQYCQQNGMPLCVVSDGFDIYINAVLGKLELEWVEVKCNQMLFEEGKKAQPYFPRASESCSCLCASCKRNAILEDVPDDSLIVFIGDGYSDFCAAKHADVIFAKNELAAYCNENKIPHHPFASFFDVWQILDKLIKNRKLKIRNQALLLRKKAYETE